MCMCVCVSVCVFVKGGGWHHCMGQGLCVCVLREVGWLKLIVPHQS